MGNDSISELVRTQVRAKEAADIKAEQKLIPPNPTPFEPQHKERELATMSRDNLLKSIAVKPETVTDVVNMQPTVVGELIQQSLATGQPETAQALLGALKSRYRGGSFELRDLLYRSTLRADGPGAKAARDAMRGLIEEDAEKLKNPLQAVLPGPPIKDPRLNALDGADRDPATAKLTANFIDRPESAAAQLMEEAEKDPASFQKHAATMEGLIQASPQAARAVASAMTRLKGPRAREVNMMMLDRAFHAMDVDVDILDHGRAGLTSDLAGGGALRRAERIAPLLAQLASYPENARALTRRSRMHEGGAGTGIGLGAVLHRALDERWSFSVRREVQALVNEGTGDMLEASLEPGVHTAETRDAARFIGEAACAESKHMKSTFGQKTGHRIAQALPFVKMIPGANQVPLLGTVVDKSAHALDEASKPLPNWSQLTTHQLLNQVYRAARPKPQANDFSQDTEAWRDGFTGWSADAMDELDQTRGCGE